ncbi:MAG: GNAT family N-acetyltransferase [Myxococcota bacterium]|nr:GNAT family N-acetyltransferase [Deltaproteobacteria bacterium]MDQ3335843.1 GNAT family N-acetyltransferase [Myxococcota bacterium]
MSRHFTSAYVENAKLRDESEVVLRLLRPEDRTLLKAGFEKLSPESRYARFFSPKATLNDDELDYLCNIDHETHFAIGALRELPDGTSVGLGIARFIKVADGAAEAAIAVADEMHGRGLGRLLFLRLCAAAIERGITTFKCEVLGSNTSMKHLLDAIAPDHDVVVTQGVMSFDLQVPNVSPTQPTSGPAPQGPMYRLFRATAEHAFDWTETIKKLWARKRTSSED